MVVKEKGRGESWGRREELGKWGIIKRRGRWKWKAQKREGDLGGNKW